MSVINDSNLINNNGDIHIDYGIFLNTYQTFAYLPTVPGLCGRAFWCAATKSSK